MAAARTYYTARLSEEGERQRVKAPDSVKAETWEEALVAFAKKLGVNKKEAKKYLEFGGKEIRGFDPFPLNHRTFYG